MIKIKFPIKANVLKMASCSDQPAVGCDKLHPAVPAVHDKQLTELRCDKQLYGMR